MIFGVRYLTGLEVYQLVWVEATKQSSYLARVGPMYATDAWVTWQPSCLNAKIIFCSFLRKLINMIIGISDEYECVCRCLFSYLRWPQATSDTVLLSPIRFLSLLGAYIFVRVHVYICNAYIRIYIYIYIYNHQSCISATVRKSIWLVRQFDDISYITKYVQVTWLSITIIGSNYCLNSHLYRNMPHSSQILLA